MPHFPGLKPRSNGARPLPSDAMLAPSRTEELLEAILEHLQDQNPMDEIGVQQTASRGTQNYGFAQADLSLALDNHHLIVPPTHNLEVVQFPEALDVLQIRVGDPGRQAWNVLADGHIAESDVAIRDLFITTAPAIPGGTLRILAGNLRIHGNKRTNFGCTPVCDQIFEIVGGQRTSLDLAVETLDGPKRFTVQHDRESGANLITNIPKGTPFRVYGRITSEDPSVAGTIVHAGVRLQKGGTEHWQDEIDGMIGGANKWRFDTGWGWVRDDNVSFAIFINDIGPVDNVLSISLTFDIIPQL